MENNEDPGTSGEQNVDDGEEVYAVGDIIKSQDAMMEAVTAVLGAGDEFNCTYTQGYMKRQALYACLTCIPDAKVDHEKSAGVCLACSYHCHDGHNLVELYTKREFRCDCGNKKFPTSPCNLQPEKDDFNEKNKYNQNFWGLYCTCARPYPDSEDPIDDYMVQCVVCEDWYHTRHLGALVPTGYDEMICEECVKKNDFLLYYDGLGVTRISKPEGGVDIPVDVEAVADASTSDVSKASDVTAESSVKESDETASTGCTRPKIKSTIISAKFMEDGNWRQKLCKCTSCAAEYEEKNVAFLLDPQDTIQVYEEKGKEKSKERDEQNLQKEQNFLNSMDRVSLVEYLAGYNDFKEQLTEFLKTFADNKKVLRIEDVQEFFSELKARKKAKLDMPYYCR